MSEHDPHSSFIKTPQPKGGDASLTEAEVARAAVEFMTSQSK